jgi:uncharacterized membrane protein YbhN (UPF0104 family)
VSEQQRAGRRRRVAKRVIGFLLGLLLLVGALWVLHREFGKHSIHEVLAILRRLTLPQIALSLLATILGYAALASQDLLALSALQIRLPKWKAVLAGFEGFAFANNLPFAVVVGGAVRARFYRGSRLSASKTTQLVLFNTATYALGLLAATGLTFTFEPRSVPGLLHLPIHSTRPLGEFALVALGFLIYWSIRGGPSIHLFKRTFRPTPIAMTLSRTGVSLLDWILSGAALFVLLPGADAYHFIGFLGVFMLGQVAGLIAQVPGGIGVFEAVIVGALGRSVPVPAIFAALIAYRVIYSLFPLGLATVIFGVHEIQRAHQPHH